MFLYYSSLFQWKIQLVILPVFWQYHYWYLSLCMTRRNSSRWGSCGFGVMSGEKMDGMVAIRWTSDRIRYRKRSRYFVRRFGFKPDLRRLLSLEIIKISGWISLVTKYLLLFLLWILSEGLRNGNHPIHPLAVHTQLSTNSTKFPFHKELIGFIYSVCYNKYKKGHGKFRLLL